MKTPIEKADAIMARLGFNSGSSDSTKAAFIKNLIKQAYGVEVALPPQYQPAETFESFTQKIVEEKPEQLSFDFTIPTKVG